MSSYVDFSIDERGIAWLTMNRPDVHNAFDDHMIAQLRAALKQASDSQEARVLVLQANGKNFSAGADLNWMRSMAEKNFDENVTDAGELGALMWELDHLRLPTIALVNGAAFGGAVGLVACCDMAIATARSSFCLSEVKIGLIPAVISPYVVRALGEPAARRYMLTAERFSAHTALQHGLLDHVLSDDDLELQSAAEPLITALLNNGPAALEACKSLIAYVSQHPLDADMVKETARRIAQIRVSDEGQEGLSAFLEKRQPAWQSKQPHGKQ
ncbi:gamma-carboxygeranoyl-CoA hydratase [Aliidiomarina halalkaliphila]|uniref:Gamma-carboxygeranoyl-CoA hydratase n=1 Tax=Aliidiomarina halalkaliphila TaxID=2593535 RepID=A0A552X393_9GAMM|nr:enoyl-CoA hydratase-related protein [Aliidiomarina halalkaliphila]TRW49504.1 gamma-carboxygeranoyl-CoA hydratase [Aliidiomarina halalkaliphila]